MREVIIFRHQMFKNSEPFIAQQADKLASFNPLYIGRRHFGNAPEGATSLALEDMKRRRGFMYRLWQVMTRDPKPYIKLLGDHCPSLIHAHFGVDGVYALPLARRLQIPLVTTFHGFDATTSTRALLTSGSPSWANYLLFMRQLADQGSLFLCVSEYIRHRVLELGFPEERTYVHYIGIDVDAIQPRAVCEEQPIVLHVARLVEKKGTEYLIRAFAQVVADKPDVKLLIVGAGPLRKSLEALVRELGIVKSVEFMGARPHVEVIELMRKATMLVLPSVTARSGDSEGLGMVLLEAAARGLPLVGTTHGGIPEIIEDGNTGCLVPERNAHLLAESILKLLSDKDLRYRMGGQARNLVKARFDMRKQTTELEKIYNSVLS